MWMRHYRNHPSVVMWVAGANFFNNAVDVDPRHVGRRGWDQSDPRWQQLMVDAGRRCSHGLKKLDPTRVYYSHEGAYTGDVYSMNCYLDLLPLQEREDWLSAWAESGEMPITMTEFGTPMDCTFRRGHDGFDSNITSEPLLTEYAAIYFGTDAYASEDPKYRQYLHNLFLSGMVYKSSQDQLDQFPDMHKIQSSTARTPGAVGAPRGCRAACTPGRGCRTNSRRSTVPTLAWIAGQPGAVHRQGPPLQLRPEVPEADRPDQRYAPARRILRPPGPPRSAARKWARANCTAPWRFRRSAKCRSRSPRPQVEAGGKADGQITLTATIGETRHQDTFAFRVFGEDQPGQR